MTKRQALSAGISTDACDHTFQASDATNFLRNGSSRDNAQKIAARKDIQITALYNRLDGEISLDELE